MVDGWHSAGPASALLIVSKLPVRQVDVCRSVTVVDADVKIANDDGASRSQPSDRPRLVVRRIVVPTSSRAARDQNSASASGQNVATDTIANATRNISVRKAISTPVAGFPGLPVGGSP